MPTMAKSRDAWARRVPRLCPPYDETIWKGVKAMRTILALLATLLLVTPSASAEKLKVGKAVPEAFSFVPLDIGMKKGFFQKYGIEACRKFWDP